MSGRTQVPARALFSPVSAHYERGSIIMTSNKGFGECGDILGDPVIKTAILKKLLHHSHVINIADDSYRLREKKKARFLGPMPQAKPEVIQQDQQSTRSFAGVDHFQTGGQWIRPRPALALERTR